MRMMNIASGSSGNATYVGSGSTHILIDSGISRKRIMEGLKKLELSLDDLSAVLVTHEHYDHISSLAMLEKAAQIPVYSTAGTASALLGKGILTEESGLLHTIGKDEVFCIGDLEVTALGTSHDAADPVCFRISNRGSSCAVVTDLGVYDDHLVDSLKGLSALMLEANHDIRMLETGPYPYPLKMRIAGKKGHLSNEVSGQLLAKLLHDDMRYIALGHLSKKNNHEELARMSVAYEIDTGVQEYRASDFRIDVADQEHGTQIYEF